jgi:hypothetical protein
MRIGILTLHDSPNYGAVLQAYAMRAYLTGLGHEAFVIDRRRDPGNVQLRTPPAERDSVRLFGLFKVDARNGASEYARRCARTLSFERDRIGMSPYHFHTWKDAPRELGLDLVLVGSDQVWNANNLDPADYLLKDVPGHPPGIAYAASIGMPELPADRVGEFRAGFARFAAIGVREREAAEMVRALGFTAEHVVDPVLLAGREVWKGLMADDTAHAPVDGTPRTFAYFLAEDVEGMLPELADFAAKTGRRIGLFVDWYARRAPHGIGGWMKNGKFWKKWRERGVDFRLDAGPEEFVRSITAAEAVISNSYHALMFSLVFGREVRIVLPTHPVRRKMNARLREFEGVLTEGPLIADTLSAALASLAAGERVTVRTDALSARVDAPRIWLANALEALEK